MIDDNEKILSSKRMKKFDKFLAKAEDEEILAAMYLMMGTRVGITVQHIQSEEGPITHQVLVITANDKFITTAPVELVWPMQPMPMPDAFKKKVN